MDLKLAFKSINKAITKRGEKTEARNEKSMDVQFERALKSMEALVLGIQVVSTVKGEDTLASPTLHGVEKGTNREMNPAQTAERVFMLLSHGVSPEAIQLHAPDLPKRFDWEPAREAIIEISATKDVLPEHVCLVFGLCEPGDKVVASDEFEAKRDAAKAAKKAARKPRKSKKEKAAEAAEATETTNAPEGETSGETVAA